MSECHYFYGQIPPFIAAPIWSLTQIVFKMKKTISLCVFGLLFNLAFAQQQLPKGLFDTDEPLRITLRGNLKPLLKDKSEQPKKQSMTLTCPAENDSCCLTFPVEAKPRGHFRRLQGNCTYPPLQINFPGNNPAHQSSIFKNQKKMKWVMPCRDAEYLVREWLVYELYNLLTAKSFRARLAQITLESETGEKTAEPFFAILLEEESQMTARNNMSPIQLKVKPKQTQQEDFLTMAVFQYMIGNTDWSTQYQQNIKLMTDEKRSAPTPVPYDFDHAGIVDAPYARPAPELQMRSIRERRYRGFCMENMTAFEPILARFQALKPEFYRLYKDCALLDEKYHSSTLQFLDAFYETIGDPKLWQKAFAYPCDPNGTGNVVIKGMKDDK